ncbi:MAG: hypothetical protein WCD44_01980 [Candidatus Babeliales bacterium]
MIEELNKILEMIKLLNQNIKKEIISKKRLKEEQVNINDFIILQQNMKKSLEKLISIDKNKSEKILIGLSDLNMDLHNVVWHIEQLHELIKKMIIYYGEEIYEKK